MEGEPKKGSDNQQRKKTVLKNGGGGGGAGAVLLLGGALATAAFVTAFIRKRRWSKDNHRRRHQNKNPRLEPEKPDESDEKNKEEQFAVLDKCSNGYRRHSSSGETELTVPENPIDISTQDGKKSGAQMNGGLIPGELFDDAGRGERRVVSTIPKVLGNGAVLDGSVVMHEVSRSLGEKLPTEPQNLIPEGETETPLINQDDWDKAMTEIKNFDGVYTEEVKTRSDPSDYEKEKSGAEPGITAEVVVDYSECLEAEKDANEEAGLGEDKSEEAIKKIEDNEDGQGTAPPLLEHVNDDNKEVALATEIVEQVGVDQVLEESHKGGASTKNLVEKVGVDEIIEQTLKEGALPTEVVEILGVDADRVGYLEEELVETQETCDHVIVLEKRTESRSKGEEADVKSLQREGIRTCEEEREENEFGTEDAEVAQVTESSEDMTLKQCAHETNTGKEAEEEVILSHEHVQDDSATKEAAAITQVNSTPSSLQFVAVDEVERDVPEEVKDSVETPVLVMETIKDNVEEADSVETIAKCTEEDDLATKEAAEITEAEDDSVDTSSSVQFAVDEVERNVTEEVEEAVKTIAASENIYNKANLSSNEAEEQSSEGLSNSSMEENHDTHPAGSLQDSSNLIVREVEGKTQHDAAAAIKDESPVQTQECNSNKHAIKKLQAKLKGQRTTVLFGALSLLSSLSCSWFFGLSFAKLCAVLFFAMLLSKIHV